MDEWILDDLLECSVCLERLDTSSKVLPCQHTFCKKCLEEIHRTHNELRCPECRILVETKIDDLPPNVLLMRILEGIRNAAPDHQSSGSFHGGSGAGSGSVSHSELSASGGGVSLDKSPHLINTKTPPNDTKLRKLTNQPYARAIYDYPAKEQGDLSFKKGDVLYLKKKIDNNWYGGVDANGKAGVFPVSYVQVIIPLPVPLCKALYDFKMMNDEEESCLSFVKDEIITVIRRVDENWAEGKLKDRIGIFPIAFVELNSVARALMKLPALEAHPGLSRIAPPAPASKVEDFVTPSTDLQPRVSTAGFSLTTDATSDSSSNTVTSPSSSSSSTPTPTTSSSLSPTSPSVVPVPNSSNKRHSFGSSLPHSALTKSKRHSAEIFISQDDEQPQSLPADIHAANQLPPAQLERSGSQRYNKNATDVPPIPGPQAKHSSLQLPALYVALYPYKPQKGDEIELKRGALYSVTERCQDGWFKGTLLRGQKTGVFPGNYVAPAKSLPALQAQLRGIGRTKPFSVSGSPKNGTPTLEPRNPMSYIKPQQMPTPPKAPETIQGGPAPSEQQSTAVVAPPNVSVQALSHKGIEKLIKDKRVGLMRRLASMKRSKSPPNTPYSMDNPVFEDSSVVFSQPVHVRSGSCPNQLLTSVADTNGASPHRLMSPSSSHRSKVKERPSLTLSIPTRYTAKPTIQHKKSSSMDTPGSLPDPSAILSHLSAAHFRSTLGDEIKSFTCSSTPSIPLNHSSSNDSFPSSASLIDPGPSDAAASKHKLKLESSTGVDFRLGGGLSGAAPSSLAPSKPPTSSSKLPASTREPSSSTHTSRNHSQSKFMARERFRCIVPYPPNSEYELELKIGDVIYVHKKRDDGWYKGTQERTGRTGLFPASFVQTF